MSFSIIVKDSESAFQFSLVSVFHIILFHSAWSFGCVSSIVYNSDILYCLDTVILVNA